MLSVVRTVFTGMDSRAVRKAAELFKTGQKENTVLGTLNGKRTELELQIAQEKVDGLLLLMGALQDRILDACGAVQEAEGRHRNPDLEEALGQLHKALKILANARHI